MRWIVVVAACTIATGALAQEKTEAQKTAMRQAGNVYLAAQECATYKNDPLVLQNQMKAAARTLGKSGQFTTMADQMQATNEVVQLYGAGQFQPEATGQAACDLVDEAMK